jgi:hypothetical protein
MPVKYHLRILSIVLVLSLVGGCGGDETVVAPGVKSKDTVSLEETHSGGSKDTATTSASGEGIGTPCTSTNDCKALGLTCKTSADCGGLSHCNVVSGVLVCTLPQFCNPCESVDNCGPQAPLCVRHPKKDSASFCSYRCHTGDGTCAAGASCVQFADKAEDFACMPDYGSCTGGGEHCSPCKTDSDCSFGTECLQPSESTERFCAQTCDPTAKDETCPSGFKCTKHGKTGYCYRITGKTKEGVIKTYPTCAKGTKSFCDACVGDFECASGRCATKNNEQFCAQPGPCTKESEAADCPYGGQATFCVDSNKGSLCAPPLSHHCHGFKACMHALCNHEETCDNGICKKVK